ncbi:hypothetical protein D6789_03050 [Candidatus Woesearchaeota archaeon]|nr:MAG: hypothetical protein D6789_03050 [Candidatus Woesearchaeota archaeon]
METITDLLQQLSNAWQHADLFAPLTTTAAYMSHHVRDALYRFGVGAVTGWVDGRNKNALFGWGPQGPVFAGVGLEAAINAVEAVGGKTGVTADDAAGVVGFVLGSYAGKAADKALERIYTRSTPPRINMPVERIVCDNHKD